MKIQNRLGDWVLSAHPEDEPDRHEGHVIDQRHQDGIHHVVQRHPYSEPGAIERGQRMWNKKSRRHKQNGHSERP